MSFCSYIINTRFSFINRLIINLTSPATVIFNEQIPSEKTIYSVYQQIVLYLQEYKAALTDDSLWSAVAGRFGKLLEIVSEVFNAD